MQNAQTRLRPLTFIKFELKEGAEQLRHEANSFDYNFTGGLLVVAVRGPGYDQHF